MPIIEFAPICTPFITTTFAPNHTLSSMTIAFGADVRGSSKWKSPSIMTQLAPILHPLPMLTLFHDVIVVLLIPVFSPIWIDALSRAVVIIHL